MPVQLPQQPAGGIPLPPQPQNPPTLADVFSALTYQKTVDAAYDNGQSNNVNYDMARAEVYKTEVVMAHSPAAQPAWFTQAITQAITPVKILAAQTRNHQLHDGQINPFVIVPFIDGTMPDGAPNNLPPLVSITAIRNLSGADSTAYVVGYGLGNPGLLVARRRAIANFIGCGVRL